MANESTPLIQTVRVGPPRRRYPHNTVRRFCTIAAASVLICGFATFLLNLVYVWPSWQDHHPPHHRPHHGHHGHHGHKGKRLSHEALQKILLETPSSEKAEEWSRYYTAGAHLAGKNYSQVRQLSSKIFIPLSFSQLIAIYNTRNSNACTCRLNGLRRDGRNGASSPASSLTMSTSTIPPITASLC
jgi:hypothetical protein